MSTKLTAKRPVLPVKDTIDYILVHFRVHDLHHIGTSLSGNLTPESGRKLEESLIKSGFQVENRGFFDYSNPRYNFTVTVYRPNKVRHKSYYIVIARA